MYYMDIDEAGTSSLNRKKDKLVPYAVMQKNNIAENVMKSAVLMPLSKVRNIWKKFDINAVESDDDTDFMMSKLFFSTRDGYIFKEVPKQYM